MKHHQHRRPGNPRVSPSVLERINLNAAGIDCGSAEPFVAVPPDRDPSPVQSFKTFTGDLVRLADWLTACGVRSVALEATGVSWIPVYEILEARGFEVLLVNARHIKNVPGRKSDVSDCEWLRELHTVGLLRGSFRPADAIVALRADLRHRQTLVERAGTSIQRMQKALVQMNLQLPLVVSDITSVTGLRILRDLVAGSATRSTQWGCSRTGPALAGVGMTHWPLPSLRSSSTSSIRGRVRHLAKEVDAAERATRVEELGAPVWNRSGHQLIPADGVACSSSRSTR